MSLKSLWMLGLYLTGSAATLLVSVTLYFKMTSKSSALTESVEALSVAFTLIALVCFLIARML